jgi:hypothetical protein
MDPDQNEVESIFEDEDSEESSDNRFLDVNLILLLKIWI